MQIEAFDGGAPFSLAVHGGAGPRRSDGGRDDGVFRAGLSAALEAGKAILADGGAARDAVTAAVAELEDRELFNAGRGAALTADGIAQLDACLADGRSGMVGAVLGSRFARNPVRAAAAVIDHTRHVLMLDPQPDVLESWGVDVEGPEYFITERRRMQLEGKMGADPSSVGYSGAVDPFQVLGPGTVGAVARDRFGNLAAATSTGGVTGQATGRVGDAPIVGAGTLAENDTAAVSCTGIGEYFLRGTLAADVAARMRYRADSLAAAAREALSERIVQRGGEGGLIGVAHDGGIVFAYSTETMLRARLDSDGAPQIAI